MTPGAGADSEKDRFLRSTVTRHTGNHPVLGVAVSGGGDSLALLHLLAGQPGLRAVTVDHGLRAEAAAEAAAVGATCSRIGVPHDILQWHWNGTGNLSDAARRGRIVLMAEWARQHGLTAVALGHTADDQAETFLMRLARGSGVDGLSGMARQRLAEGVIWLRPLLDITRTDLRAYLQRRGASWFDDPTNDDATYQRVRARAAMAHLGPLGITTQRLVDTARSLAMAREVAQLAALQAARQIARIEAGDVVFDREGLLQLPLETQGRLTAHAIGWIASVVYRPRRASLELALAAVALRKRHTIGGCLLIPTLRQIRVTRELRAVAQTRRPVGAVWDARWCVSGPVSNGLEIGALGADGLARIVDWRRTGLPRSTLLASPAVWHGLDLVAAPLAGLPGDWQACLHQDADTFFMSLLSH